MKRGACKTSFVGSASAVFRSQNSVFRIGTNSLATSYTHSDSWILNAEFALANTPEGFCKSLKKYGVY
jgi:hypothetical protein